MNILLFLEYIGICVFAYNGTQTTLSYTSNIFISILFGIVTAIGGGTIRDLFFRKVPFWYSKQQYILLSLLFASFFLLNTKLKLY